MFFPRSTAPRVREADLAELRLSLNAPVISTDALPPGPARAAIALVREKGGRFTLAIGVRSLRTGETAVFTPDEPYPDAGAAAVGVDAALSFAEGMGFLFDDDELVGSGPGARDRALARWCELLGEPQEELADELVLAAQARAPDEAFELVLEDAVADDTLLAEPDSGPAPALFFEPLAQPPAPPAAARARFEGAHETRDESFFELEPDAPVPTGEPPAAAAIAPATPAPRAAAPAAPAETKPAGRPKALPLTKFRRSSDNPAAPPGGANAAPPGGASAGAPPTQGRAVLVTKHGPALGRLQLVKRRREPDGAPQPSWLQRLLGSF